MSRSMQCRNADQAQAIAMVPGQSMEHRKYVFVGRVFKRVVCHLYGHVKQVVVSHAAIVGVASGYGHSYFPVDWYAYILGKAALNRIHSFLREVDSA